MSDPAGNPAGTVVHREVVDGVAVLTLDGPATLNAFTRSTGAALGEAYAACDADDTVRVVVLTGAGRAFCSGADVSPGSEPFTSTGADFTASPVRPPAWQVRKPVLAAVNGPAIGIGLTLALQCDVRIVAEDAKLAIPQVRRGMIGDAASHHTLRQHVGLAVAADLLLTGRTILGAEAAARGLASRAVPAAEVLTTALAIARDVATYANPAALAHSKRLLWADLGLAEAELAETAAHLDLMGGPDSREGAAAWREGRAPQWRGRASQVNPAAGRPSR